MPAAFHQGVQDGSIVGLYGFPESISMMARALGWHIDRTVQHRKPIISRVKRVTPFVTIVPGRPAGCPHTAVASRHDEPVITLRDTGVIQEDRYLLRQSELCNRLCVLLGGRVVEELVFGMSGAATAGACSPGRSGTAGSADAKASHSSSTGAWLSMPAALNGVPS